MADIITQLAGLGANADAAGTSCPGVLIARETFTGCCVGGSLDLELSSCAGWPICTGPVTVTTTSAISCATVIAVTDSNYNDEINSAKASMDASGTNMQTTLASDLAGFTAGPSKGDSGSTAANTGSPAPTATKPSAGNRLMNGWGDLKLVMGVAAVVLLMAGQF